jgi:hypothetical protein
MRIRCVPDSCILCFRSDVLMIMVVRWSRARLPASFGVRSHRVQVTGTWMSPLSIGTPHARSSFRLLNNPIRAWEMDALLCYDGKDEAPPRHAASDRFSLQAFYLPNATRANLKVLTGAAVTKVLFRDTLSATDEKIADGVQFSYGENLYSVKAEKEVVLCAG